MKVREYRRGDYYKVWNVLMKRRQTAYLNLAVFEPARKHFPDVRLSNYNYYYSCPPHSCPDFNGHDFGDQSVDACDAKSLHVGTHQSRSLYAVIGSLRYARVQNGEIRLRGKGQRYGVSPFKAFRLNVNQMRSMVLSSDVPVQPWISHKGFRSSQVKGSDLYQELLFHVGLCDPDPFLYWNTWSGDKIENPDGEKDRLVSDCLARLTELVGTSDRKTRVEKLAPWDAPFVLTGMNAGGRSVWRFTPELPEGTTLQETRLQDEPATFHLGEIEISIPGGRIHEPGHPLSSLGYWILGELDAEPAVTRRER